MNQQTKQILSKYIDLIDGFVSGFVTASEFENRYLKMFKNETYHFEETIFFKLDELFAVADAYCPDETIRDAFDTSEEQLLETAKNVSSFLKHF
jgi:hypothetical protein